MTFFRGPNYAELEEEISSITEAKEEKQFDASKAVDENSSFFQTASKIASLKFFRPFSCVGVIYIIYELSGKFRVGEYLRYSIYRYRRYSPSCIFIYTGAGKIFVPRFGEFCFCCCLPLQPQLPCRVLTTWGPQFCRPLYINPA